MNKRITRLTVQAVGLITAFYFLFHTWILMHLP